jgi:N-acyl-D-amino-acid deacylase
VTPAVDLLIRSGVVVDGAGNPAAAADVAVTGGRIAAVGHLGAVEAREVIDATGHVVCPGFIDMHTHSDLQILARPDHTAKVSQGITTEVLGQDGLSYAPVDDATLAQLRLQLRGWNDDPEGFDWDWRTVGEYLDRLDRGIAVNAAYLIPHGTVRMLVVGQEDRPATPDELERMCQVVAQGMEEGAVGLSAGLTYTPGMYAPDSELVELCRVVASYGGYYCPHHRNYGAHSIAGYRACIDIARASGVALQLTHAHLGFPPNKGKAPELLAMVDAALDEGLEVTLDTYPYLAGSTYLQAFLPPWVQEGGTAVALERLTDPANLERMRFEIEETGHAAYHDVPTDWSTVVVTGVRAAENERYVGRSIADAAAEEGRTPFEVYRDVLVADELGTTCVHHIGNEENVRAIMTHPAHTGGSDGLLVGERPHPRAWGTFPRYLARYVRELGVLRLEDAIRKFTSLPAQRLGFRDRGLVRPGMAADLVVFHPAQVRDVGTYEEPRRRPEGIPHVIVNGVPVVRGGAHTGARPGRALRRGA